MNQKRLKIARCEDCHYISMTLLDNCSKCSGRLEIIAEEREDGA